MKLGIERFGDKLGVLEEVVLEQVILALAVVTGLEPFSGGEIDRP